MRAFELDDIEEKFNSTLSAGGRQFTKSEGMFSYVTKLTTKNPKHITKKDIKPVRIVLHFTVGHLASDISTLTNSTVTVPFVVARNGDVFQLSEPGKEVGYHLGSGAGYSNTTESYRSIGIEISNFGGLKLKSGTDILLDAYGKEYCKLSDTQHYDKLETSFRGFQYFASYTEGHYSALSILIDDLCDKYNIPKTTTEDSKKFKHCVADVLKPTIGISSHVQWRNDKSDLAPNFDWKKIGF